MSRPAILVLLIAAGVGGWYFLNNYQVLGLQQLDVKPRNAGGRGQTAWKPAEKPAQPPVQTERDSIRIATFNLGGLDRKKLSSRHVASHLVKLIRDFDIVAVQDIHAYNQGILVDLIDQVNSQGRHYDFAAKPMSPVLVERHSALLFDRSSVGIDRSTVYSVRDPAGRFRREPLVASFRARGPDPTEAFTFTVINVHTDPDRAAVELGLLDEVLRAVRDDGRGEDDIILLGDLGTDNRHLEQLVETLDVIWVVSDTQGLRGSQFSDNVLFDRRATSEFTGRSGVVDLMREFDLSMQQALEISDHLPVWAEFSVFEGGCDGHVASGRSLAPR